MNLILIVIALIFVYWILSSIFRSLFRQTVTLNFTSKKEAQDRIKSLKLSKKNLGAKKKEINAEIKAIKLEHQKYQPKKSYSTGETVSRKNFYTERRWKEAKDYLNSRRSTYARDKENHRNNLAKKIEPFEKRKINIDKQISEIDYEIVSIERWLSNNS